MGFIGDLGSLLTGGANIGAAIGQYALGKQAADIDAQNLQLQRDNLEYQKLLQKTMFNREDTSIQRRVADLKAAGLSPVLAAGTGAQAGPVVTTRAPERDVRGLNMQMQALGNIATVGKTTMDALATIAQVKKTNAETSLIEQTTPGKVEELTLHNTLLS